ncbi:ABC transporter permease [Alkaliphilus pronyensis]|uniref:ABC transporter permease n=1 Tax=Alkaliphilus pronyensis TaxID=1482732 RepID=A0A6I0F838_9FIRM|nr:ABC transporter permease [Alkaliphilus pronyensis]KAB3534486.1 ABC transporter permease [Alkaliphilus pronyensis]
MNILTKLTLQNLKLNKKRTIVTIIGIILSGAMICGVATIAASSQDLMIQSAIKTDGNYHAVLNSVKYEDSKYIRNNPSTAKDMLSKEIGFSIFEKSNINNKPYIHISAYDSNTFKNMPVKLKEGRWPKKYNEIVITEDILTSGGSAYNIGKKVKFEVGNRLNGGNLISRNTPFIETEELDIFSLEEYIITGIIHKPRMEYGLSPAYTAITYLDEALLNKEDTIDVFVLLKKPKNIYDIIPKMAENVGDVSYKYNNELLKWMRISKNENANNMFNKLALIMFFLVVVGSVTVIYNAFAISVSERKKQFGMLSSVGATRNQISKMIFYEGALLGGIGIPIGILSGIVGIGITIKVVNSLIIDSMFNEDVALRLIISPYTILTTVLFMSITILLSVYIPAKKASKISPVEAIRLNTDIKIKGKNLKTSKLTRFLYGIEGELALKNLKRNHRRYRATVFSLFISIVLFVSFSSFMRYGLMTSNMYYGAIDFDLAVSMKNIPLEKQLELYNKTAGISGVDRYSIVRRINTSTKLQHSQLSPYVQKGLEKDDMYKMNEDGSYNNGIYIVAVGKEEFKRYIDKNQLEPSTFMNTNSFHGVLVNKNNIGGRIEYEPMNIEAGDTLYLKDSLGESSQISTDIKMEIGAVADNLPLGVPYTDFMMASIVVSEEVFEELRQLISEEGLKLADKPNMIIQTNNSDGITEALKQLDPNISENSLSIVDISEMKDAMLRITTVIAIFLYGFVTLITLIGVTNIFNTISTNVALRRREFAMLKSVGLTPKGFNKMINYESIFYGLKALLYGMPVGVAISVWIYNSFGYIFEFTFVLPWREMLICTIGVFIIIFITMMHSSAKLKKENIIDALREENL